MFQQPKTYPQIPQSVKEFLRNINGVVVPKFIRGEKVEILADIQVAQIGDAVIPIYKSVEDPWVDAVYDCWIEIGKIDSPEIERLATNKIQDHRFWIIK